jgi:hypothetical protein
MGGFFHLNLATTEAFNAKAQRKTARRKGNHNLSFAP